MPNLRALIVAAAVGAIVACVVLLAVVVQVVEQFWWLIALGAPLIAAVKYFAHRRARNTLYGGLSEIPRRHS